MGIESNVAQRQMADEIIELMIGSSSEFTEDEHYWQILAEHVATHLPPPEVAAKDQPMTDDEAAKFGRSPMPFGEFLGKPVISVPLERVAWYTDQDWTRKADRYLKNKLVRYRHARESEADES